MDCWYPVLAPLALFNPPPVQNRESVRERETEWERERERGRETERERKKERERERETHADFTLMLVYFFVCCVIHCFSEVLANLGKVYILSITALPNSFSLWGPRIAITALPNSLSLWGPRIVKIMFFPHKMANFKLLRFFFAHDTLNKKIRIKIGQQILEL